ncbi:MAG TPA: hypothetical protein VH107_01230 [Lacipirellulaceae bacterium]|jgi:hypothetical protein|nr:hypothetical protein [Lacipirellulaceae bacterium]
MNGKTFKTRRIQRQAASLSAAVLCCVAITGCGNGLAKVSGHVTVDDQPLHGGNGNVRVTVQFQPANGVGPTAMGLADENGMYSLSTGSQAGIQPGEYLVSCAAEELVINNAGAVTGAHRTTDPKYGSAKTSGLKFTIQAGKNEINIPLKSLPKTPQRSGV